MIELVIKIAYSSFVYQSAMSTEILEGASVCTLIVAKMVLGIPASSAVVECLFTILGSVFRQVSTS